MRGRELGQWPDVLFLPTHYLLPLALFFRSRDSLIAQKLGPHIVQYSPAIWCPARK